MYNKLSFVTKNTSDLHTDSVHDYEDIYIDGKSLKSFLPFEYVEDLVTTLGWSSNRTDDIETVNIFKKISESEIENNRVILYCCPVCAGPMCGAITVDVVETENEFVWTNFMFENQYSEPVKNDFEHVPDFCFSKIEYLSTLDELLRENL